MPSLYDTAKILLDAVQFCMGDCDYDYFVSMGEPPAVCSSIAVFWDRMDRGIESDGCNLFTDNSLAVMLTRCCPEPEDFDPAEEDASAKCFLDDLLRLKRCIQCTGLEALNENDVTHDCRAEMQGIDFDQEREGGCYSARLSITFSEYECCPEEE